MNRVAKNFWTWAMLVVVVLFCLAGTGCESDDEDSPSTTTTIVTTNVVNGVVQTNVVEVPVEPPVEAVDGGDPVEEAAAGPTGFLGLCNGKYENAAGSSDIGGTLELAGSDVTGVFGISGNRRGFVTGSLTGFSLSMTMPVLHSDIWIRMQGQLNGAGTLFQGTWVDNNGNTGTCWLQSGG
jgi:hypothetical protein